MFSAETDGDDGSLRGAQLAVFRTAPAAYVGGIGLGVGAGVRSIVRRGYVVAVMLPTGVELGRVCLRLQRKLVDKGYDSV